MPVGLTLAQHVPCTALRPRARPLSTTASRGPPSAKCSNARSPNVLRGELNGLAREQGGALPHRPRPRRDRRADRRLRRPAAVVIMDRMGDNSAIGAGVRELLARERDELAFGVVGEIATPRDEPAPLPPPPLVIPPPPWSEHYQDELDDPARSSYPAPRQTKPKPTPNRDEVRGWREEDA
jgi:hypothetical protein